MKKILYFSALCVMGSFLLYTKASSDVAIKIVVVNPSDTKEENVPVKYYLPPEITKDSIVETNGLNIEYDITKAAYYVYGELKLSPKEARTLKVSIKDVWKIPPEKFDELSNILHTKLKAAEKDEKLDQEAIKLLAEGVTSNIEALKKSQEEIADDIEKRMQMFGTMMQKLKTIESDIYVIDKIKNLRSNEEEREETITLIIESENIKNEKATLPVKYYLPREILPQHVVEKSDFELKYDMEKDQFYFYKELEFEANETKRFQTKIKNIWIIPERLINNHVNEADGLNKKLADTGYEPIGEMLYNSIKQNADLILESQQKADSVKEYISIYRENEKRLNIMEDDLQKLRDLNMKLIDEEDKNPKSLTSLLDDVDYLIKLKQMINEFFKQKVRQGNIWKILVFVVGFIIVFTVIFYGLWYVEMKRDQSLNIQKIEVKEKGKEEKKETKKK